MKNKALSKKLEAAAAATGSGVAKPAATKKSKSKAQLLELPAMQEASEVPAATQTGFKVKLKAAAPKPGELVSCARRMNGAHAYSFSASYVKELELRKIQMEEQLLSVEVQIYKLETQYVEGVNPR